MRNFLLFALDADGNTNVALLVVALNHNAYIRPVAVLLYAGIIILVIINLIQHIAQESILIIISGGDGDDQITFQPIRMEIERSCIAELSAIFKRLYEDSVTGRISDERFTELSADYEAEQRELKERAAAIQAELSKAQEATVNAEKFMNVVRRHTSFEELTPTLLREFVEKIVVHECSYDENKTRRQDIEIYYSFVGKVDLPE